ncbi:MAG TPA: Rieske 2Fe-2S domain-containing protein, partial [Longimicrobiales bacterium]|nr:Rieske 2Fe-2S domain-containing protein [Longimicrobiales bacterium]
MPGSSDPARYPFPTTPNSWYGVAWSHEVEIGASLPVRAFGRDLVVFRGEDGVARVLDARCPHLGAHLGVGGRVRGNTVECPFHAWRFDGHGHCVDIPYADRIPSKARVRAWTCEERNGAILVWFHAQGAAPDWQVPTLPMCDPRRWTRPRYHSVDVRTHVQEMNENIFDYAHFVYIHHYEPGPEPTLEIDGPFAHATLVGGTRVAGRVLTAHTRASLYGAGFTVIHVHKPVEFAVIVLKTPLDDETVQHRYAVVSPRRLPVLDQVLVRALTHQVTADVVADSRIWENKEHLVRPLLVRRDGPIMHFRKWH